MEDTVKNEEIEKEVAENEEIQSKSKDEYSIFNYFKEHTTFLVACVSGVVALLSFVVSCAVRRYNVSYLAYWNVDSIYAAGESGIQIDYVFFAFLFSFVLMCMHWLMGTTAETFRVHNEMLSRTRWRIRALKKDFRQLRKSERELDRELSYASDHVKESKRVLETDRVFYETHRKYDYLLIAYEEEKKTEKTLYKYMCLNIFLSIVLFVIVGIVFSALMVVDLRGFISHIKTMGFLLLFDLCVYFIPAYMSSCCTKKRHEEYKKKEIKYDKHYFKKFFFPLDQIIIGGTKTMFTNSKIWLGSIQLILTIVILLFSCSLSGGHEANRKSSFPICRVNDEVYAIIHNNGKTIVLENADIENETITIDTRKQKVVSSSDISYEIFAFDTVKRIDIGDTK